MHQPLSDIINRINHHGHGPDEDLVEKVGVQREGAMVDGVGAGEEDWVVLKNQELLSRLLSDISPPTRRCAAEGNMSNTGTVSNAGPLSSQEGVGVGARESGDVRRRITPVYKPGYIEVITLSPYGKESGNAHKEGDLEDGIEFVRHVREDPKANIAAQSKEEKCHIDEFGDGETLIVSQTHGTRALKDLPHPRPLCAVHNFGDANEKKKFCDNCFCVRCEAKAGSCKHWDLHAVLPLPQLKSDD